jgi:hypothetical protein
MADADPPILIMVVCPGVMVFVVVVMISVMEMIFLGTAADWVTLLCKCDIGNE